MTATAATDLRLCFAGGFSIDAVLFADGTFDVDRIGGNALWAAAGALANGATPHAYSAVGSDYPASALDRLRSLGIDVSAVRRDAERIGVRVTYTYRPDGSRSQPADPAALGVVPEPYRSRFIDTTQNVDSPPPQVDVDDLPVRNDGSLWHLGLLPVARFRALVAHLHGTRADYLQVDCPARSELRITGLDALGTSLEAVDVFLPSTSDTDVFLPGLDHREVLAEFRRRGARTIVLKCGEDGAIVAEEDGALWHVPAVRDPHENDATGSGDVFAGAFAAAVRGGADHVAAACRGAATASLATRYREPLRLAEIDGADIDRNTAAITRGVTRL